MRPVVPWNKGAFVGPKPPLKPKQVGRSASTCNESSEFGILPSLTRGGQLETTVRYLGVDAEEILTLSEATEV
jgi:hypothetical protein